MDFSSLDFPPCLGKDRPQRDPCPNAKTQTQLNQCAAAHLRRADAEMNDNYQRLLAQGGGQPGALEKIKVAERAWIADRDAYLEALDPAADKREYGSIHDLPRPARLPSDSGRIIISAPTIEGSRNRAIRPTTCRAQPVPT